MSNSPLVSYTRLSNNNYGKRNTKIVGVTPHVFVGQTPVENMCSWFCNPAANSSANYCIGVDGRIALNVPEDYAAWTSSSKSNDMSHVTIECASDMTHPYAINDKVYNSLVRLIADIHKRNNLGPVTWKADPSLIGRPDLQNMTVHRWFKNKACPGDYVFSRLGKIAAEANEIINGNPIPIPPKPPVPESKLPEPPFMVKVKINDLNFRSTPDDSNTANIEGQTGVGTFEIVEVQNGWGKLKSGAGWIWLCNPDYCEINASSNTSGTITVKVDITDLNIRTGPGTDYPKTGSTTGIGAFTIVDIKAGKGSDLGWGKLMSGAGWIALDFAKRI